MGAEVIASCISTILALSFSLVNLFKFFKYSFQYLPTVFLFIFKILSTFLLEYPCSFNLIIDNYRQERCENTISNDDVEVDLLNNIKLCDGTVEDRMVQSQILLDVRKLVNYLPDNQREVLELRYYQDFSFKEIAEMTGVSINTALGRMRYAILNLRRMAEEYHIELSMT